MTALAADALGGIQFTADPALACGFVDLGARAAVGDETVDLFVVTLDGADPSPAGDDHRPAALASLKGAADGQLAAALTNVFAAARAAHPRLRPGGCLLFVLANASAAHAEDDPARAALGSLTRTLALEWAPERVNALVCGDPRDAVEAAALIAWPASRTLTGAVIDVAVE